VLNGGQKIQGLWILNAAIYGIEASFLGDAAFGPSRELPEGSRLLVCGRGFDEHTVKVLWNGHYYFVYARQLGESGLLH
jgi:hypothetical protein